MVFVAIFIFIVAAAFFAAIVYWGAKSGKIQAFFQAHPRMPKVLTLGYIVFAGCFVFPIRSEPFPLDVQKVYLLAGSYGVIASAFAGIFGPRREWMVYFATLFLTAAGMGCRYLLEFGEVSNTYNFTLFNGISYLALIPAGTAMVYHWMAGALKW